MWLGGSFNDDPDFCVEDFHPDDLLDTMRAFENNEDENNYVYPKLEPWNREYVNIDVSDEEESDFDENDSEHELNLDEFVRAKKRKRAVIECEQLHSGVGRHAFKETFNKQLNARLETSRKLFTNTFVKPSSNYSFERMIAVNQKREQHRWPDRLMTTTTKW